MITLVHNVETIAGQIERQCLDQPAGYQLIGYQNIAANTNTLSGDDCLDCVKLFSEMQMIHLTEHRYVAPPASRVGQPLVPRRRVRNEVRPMLVNKEMASKVYRIPERYADR